MTILWRCTSVIIFVDFFFGGQETIIFMYFCMFRWSKFLNFFSCQLKQNKHKTAKKKQNTQKTKTQNNNNNRNVLIPCCVPQYTLSKCLYPWSVCLRFFLMAYAVNFGQKKTEAIYVTIPQSNIQKYTDCQKWKHYYISFCISFFFFCFNSFPFGFKYSFTCNVHSFRPAISISIT